MAPARIGASTMSPLTAKFVVLASVGLFLKHYPSTAYGQDAAELLKKENELLKKENELLKKEVEFLKNQVQQLKEAQGSGKKDPESNVRHKATVDGVEYELVSAKRNGEEWEITVSAVSKKGRVEAFGMWQVFSIDENGKKTKGNNMPAYPRLIFPEDEKVKFTVQMGPLSTRVKKIAHVEFKSRTSGSQRIVFKDITIDP
jgi:hypothetical protein